MGLRLPPPGPELCEWPPHHPLLTFQFLTDLTLKRRRYDMSAGLRTFQG